MAKYLPESWKSLQGDEYDAKEIKHIEVKCSVSEKAGGEGKVRRYRLVGKTALAKGATKKGAVINRTIGEEKAKAVAKYLGQSIEYAPAKKKAPKRMRKSCEEKFIECENDAAEKKEARAARAAAKRKAAKSSSKKASKPKA